MPTLKNQPQINSLMMHFQVLGKQELVNPKVIRKKEITKMTAEI
jgi:hypothetical protein